MSDDDQKDQKNQLLQLIQSVSKSRDADVLSYYGGISWAGYDDVAKLCRQSKQRPNVLLILTTVGGDPHAAYRIARTLAHQYNQFDVFIPGICKSAGTLITLGATRILLGHDGELGPLDTQVRKPEEIGELGSGLDLDEALSSLRTRAFDTFLDYLLKLKVQGGIATKLSAEIATNMTVGLFAPVYGQIDPIRLGEMQRAVTIAYEYGERLSRKSKNLKDEALERLVVSYKSHGFVIDQHEAKELFRRVEAPTVEESRLAEILDKSITLDKSTDRFVYMITDMLTGDQHESQRREEDIISPEPSKARGESEIRVSGSEEESVPQGADSRRKNREDRDRAKQEPKNSNLQ